MKSAVHSLNILLIACYELGHQPFNLAFPQAVLQEAGYTPAVLDLSVEPLSDELAASAGFIAISVPMHTALRLGVETARRIRKRTPSVHICFYGLYAHLNAGYLFSEGLADSVLAGELEDELVSLVRAVSEGGTAPNGNAPAPLLTRLDFPIPARSNLPPLDRYAGLQRDGEMYLAGYTEATRGCLHTCQHCPVVPVYNGRFFVIPFETVMADIRQQAAAGARHISFGDPDFLNGPRHALRIARAIHAEFPHITFDFTTKVEHILKHREIFPELKSLGAAFVISAFEAVSGHILDRLQKGHTRAGLDAALEILGDAGIPVQPTWVPFTPWTTLGDYLDLLTWIRTRRLVGNVPVVQLSIRLLVPPQSALLDHPDCASWLGPLDPANFTYRWTHPDPRMDHLQKEIAAYAETAAGLDPHTAFTGLEHLAYAAAGEPAPHYPLPLSSPPPPPRLTEDWFC